MSILSYKTLDLKFKKKKEKKAVRSYFWILCFTNWKSSFQEFFLWGQGKIFMSFSALNHLINLMIYLKVLVFRNANRFYLIYQFQSTDIDWLEWHVGIEYHDIGMDKGKEGKLCFFHILAIACFWFERMKVWTTLNSVFDNLRGTLIASWFTVKVCHHLIK